MKRFDKTDLNQRQPNSRELLMPLQHGQTLISNTQHNQFLNTSPLDTLLMKRNCVQELFDNHTTQLKKVKIDLRVFLCPTKSQSRIDCLLEGPVSLIGRDKELKQKVVVKKKKKYVICFNYKFCYKTRCKYPAIKPTKKERQEGVKPDNTNDKDIMVNQFRKISLSYKQNQNDNEQQIKRGRFKEDIEDEERVRKGSYGLIDSSSPSRKNDSSINEEENDLADNSEVSE